MLYWVYDKRQKAWTVGEPLGDIWDIFGIDIEVTQETFQEGFIKGQLLPEPTEAPSETPAEYKDVLKTYNDWKKAGRQVNRGQKAKGFFQGNKSMALFSYDQTVSAEKKEQKPAGKLDDLEDDVPF